MNSTTEYVNQVNKTIKNIDEFTEEQLFKTCLLLQNAGLTVPRIAKTATGVSVSVRSATAKKTVIFSIKNLADAWMKLDCSRAFMEYTKEVAQEDFDVFGANMRCELKKGRRRTGQTISELEKGWRDAFNAAQSEVAKETDDLEAKVRIVLQRHFIAMAWSGAMYRMFSELFLAAMEDGQDDGMTLLYGHRAKVMYTHTEGNLLVLRQTFGDKLEIKAVVLDL